MSYERINVSTARSIIDTQNALLIDIRDAPSFESGHMENAILIDNSNITQFIADADFDRPLIVCCYHGNMSQGAADYFSQQGFAHAYSLDGGYSAWVSNNPE
ncbi:MAG: thiosulfate sulfurtransferase GlpE [Pseudomonadales bacterium]|nr:thiosulfate sulfurtransferase GlpE [Pseudomonadales bacterium]